ncbi:MAG: VWA domain-containing protein [Lentisphaeria bacterium]|nr:VWA domain-containing protein [Lentisphaeria bacterium]
MRRLPIFLAIDVSESMAGEPIGNVKQGVRLLAEALASDPMAMETAYLSIITFAGTAKVVTPLTQVCDFQVPELPIGSGTSLSAALTLLDREIDANVKKNTPEAKGDWRPLVFILTDGAPTDKYQAAVAKWKAKYGSKVEPVAVLMGEDSDASALASLTVRVLVFKDHNEAAYTGLFRWVSSSVQAGSKEIGTTGRQSFFDEKRFQNLEKDLLADNLPSVNKVEYLVIPARCMKSRKLYIIRAVRRRPETKYHYDGAYPVDESYFELSGRGKNDKLTVSSSDIAGKNPPCPYCENPALGFCACGACHCLPGANAREVKCPWCGGIHDYLESVLKINGGRD